MALAYNVDKFTFDITSFDPTLSHPTGTVVGNIYDITWDSGSSEQFNYIVVSSSYIFAIGTTYSIFRKSVSVGGSWTQLMDHSTLESFFGLEGAGWTIQLFPSDNAIFRGSATMNDNLGVIVNYNGPSYSIGISDTEYKGLLLIHDGSSWNVTARPDEILKNIFILDNNKSKFMVTSSHEQNYKDPNRGLIWDAGSITVVDGPTNLTRQTSTFMTSVPMVNPGYQMIGSAPLSNGRILYYSQVDSFELDPATNIVYTSVNTPSTLYGVISSLGNINHCVCDSGNKVLLHGGWYIPGPTPVILRPIYYSVSDHTWHLGPNDPTMADSSLVQMADGTVLCIGGFNLSGSNLISTTMVKSYDPVANTMTTKASMNHARTRTAACQLTNGKVAVICGEFINTITNGPIFTIEVYDPVANSWANKSATGPSDWGSSPVINRYRTSAYQLASNKVFLFVAFSNNVYIYDSIADTLTLQHGLTTTILTDRGQPDGSPVTGPSYNLNWEKTNSGKFLVTSANPYSQFPLFDQVGNSLSNVAILPFCHQITPGLDQAISISGSGDYMVFQYSDPSPSGVFLFYKVDLASTELNHQASFMKIAAGSSATDFYTLGKNDWYWSSNPCYKGDDGSSFDGSLG